MFFSLQDKNVFITGGASGIGLEIAKRFKAAGANIIIADVQDGTAIATEIDAHYLCLDVSNSGEVDNSLKKAVSQIGKLDVLINNAGINGKDGVSIEESDEELTAKPRNFWT